MPSNENAGRGGTSLSKLFRPVWLLFAVLTLLLACKEKDVPYVNDTEEIIRYVQETYEGKLLFGSDSLIFQEPYKIYPDSADYRDSLLLRTREYAAFISDQRLDYGHLGALREGVLVQMDKLTVKRSRILNGSVVDTVVQDRQVLRHGVFLKLGDDNQDYVGWLLWGFNGLGLFDPPSIFTVTEPDQSVIPGDRSLYTENLKDANLQAIVGGYIKLQNIDTVPPGATLVLKAERRPPNDLLYFHLYTAPSTDRYRQFSMTRLGDNNFIDTLQTPSGVPRRYSFIFVQTFFETQDKKFIRGFFVPYQVIQ